MVALWDPRTVGLNVVEYLQTQHRRDGRQFDMIITFDKGGVSGHLNHIALDKGLRMVRRDKKFAFPGKIYCLETTGLVRKYIGMADALLTARWGAQANDRFVCCSVRPWHAYRSMQIHWSQFVWFRKLFVIFSRYAYVNSLFELKD